MKWYRGNKLVLQINAPVFILSAVFIFVAVSMVVLLSPALFDLKGSRAEPSTRPSDVTPPGLPDTAD